MNIIGSGGHYGNLADIIGNDSIDGTVLAFGGVTCEALESRYKIRESSKDKFKNLIHASAVISPKHSFSDGIQIMANTTIQHNVTIDSCCIINTGAIIEHDAIIGKGCHIAPGAVVLGGAKVGDFCFVGANAVVVQGCVVPDRTFIKAGTVWKNK